ncbi:CO/xanthine dehydrogenase Mo-binding subunit [Sinorhizobium fredii]
MTATSIGKPLTRVDGRAKVTGAAHYAADFNQPDQLYAVIVNATVGLGRVSGIWNDEVERMPGVVAVITHPQRAETGLPTAQGRHRSGRR